MGTLLFGFTATVFASTEPPLFNLAEEVFAVGRTVAVVELFLRESAFFCGCFCSGVGAATGCVTGADALEFAGVAEEFAGVDVGVAPGVAIFTMASSR